MTINETVRQYREYKIKMAELERGIKPLYDSLFEAALQVGGTLTLDDATIKVIEASRETIATKEAKAALGDKLNPFLKTSFYSVLKVS